MRDLEKELAAKLRQNDAAALRKQIAALNRQRTKLDEQIAGLIAELKKLEN